MKRYAVVCVADGVPGRGSYDDLDEAIVNTGLNFEVYDRETGQYLGPTCREDYEEAVARVNARNPT